MGSAADSDQSGTRPATHHVTSMQSALPSKLAASGSRRDQGLQERRCLRGTIVLFGGADASPLRWIPPDDTNSTAYGIAVVSRKDTGMSMYAARSAQVHAAQQKWGGASTVEGSVRALISAVAIIGAVVVLPSIASAQQGDDCREVVKASASAPGTGPVGKLRARERAISAWRQRAAARYGGRFTTWLKAHQRSVDCNPAGDRTRCTVEAFPCRKW